MNYLRVLLVIRRMDKVPNARIRELCEVTKGVDERIGGVLRWFGHVKRMENDRIARSVYVGKCTGNVKDRLKKKVSTSGNQRIVHDKSE